MLTHLLSLLFVRAADGSGADGGGGEAPAAPAGDGGQPGGKAPDQSAPEGPKLKEESVSELARRTGVLKNLQAENTKLKEQLAASQPKTTDDQGWKQGDNPFDHPAVKGLQKGAEGNSVIYRGTEMAPETVIALAETQQTVADLQKQLADGKQSQSDAEYQAKLDAGRKDVIQSTAQTLTEFFQAADPKLQGDAFTVANADFLERAEKELTRLGVEYPEDITPELLTKAADEALKQARRLGSIYAERQIAGNQAHGEQHPIQPGTKPAGDEVPIDESKLSRGERAKLQAQRSKEAREKSRRDREG